MDDELLLMKRKERNEAEGLKSSRGALGYEQTGAEPRGKSLQNIGEESYIICMCQYFEKE